MAEYIARSLAKAEFTGNFQDAYPTAQIHALLDTIPAADVVEVRHGRWISVAADVLFRCSLCDCEVSTSWGYDQDGMFDYCPCCGAKMDGGETYG